jgi:putative ATP-dependent endonuclease of the OLD family
MQLRSVTVRNFRGLVDITVDLDDTTVLIGENNMGKTSFLDALKLCLAQGVSRRGDLFDDYDHHLASDQAQVGDAGETEIILHFAETKIGEWSAEIIQSISDAITLVGDLNQISLRVKSSRDSTTGEMTTAWEFLNATGDSLRPKRPTAFILRDLQQIKPFFYLSAVRDATREFQPRSAFWGPFLKNPAISDEVRKELEAELDALNAKVIAADDKLKDVKARLEKTSGIVSIQDEDAIVIEAVPGKARDLLSRAQVSVSGRTGARLPMIRHGAGTQSLSVLFLFESFLSTMLETTHGVDCLPIVAIEEPEAHLHPAASRALWTTISDMPGQKIIATHSGDLLARVPLSKLRRFCHEGAQTRVRRLMPDTLNQTDMRKMMFHVRATRGELLFARSWLLVEGATEVWLFEGIAQLLGLDLEREGVRIIQYAQVMPEPFIRLADDLGIQWTVFADGDAEGKAKVKGVPSLLKGRDTSKHLFILTEPNVEVHLCKAGLGHVYLKHVAPQKSSIITAAPTAPEYWEQVVEAIPKRGKEARAIEAVEEMDQQGPASVPLVLRETLKRVVQLAGGKHVA